MRNEEYLKILEQLDNSDRSTLLEVLPQKIDSSVLSRILNREIQPIKSSRDYCLGSYSSIYSKALPFMKSGSDKFNRGEVIYLSELISDFKGQESKLTELLRSANPDSSISNYKYNHKVEAERMAELILQTKGSDTYEGLYHELLDLLLNQNKISGAHYKMLLHLLPEAESLCFNRSIDLLNPLPGFSSKRCWVSDGSQPEPSTTKNIVSYTISRIDKRGGSLDSFAPLMRDLIEKNMTGSIAEDTLGLSSFSPLLEALEKSSAFGVVITVENGTISNLSVAMSPKEELAIPQYSPLKSMIAIMLGKSNLSEDKKFDIDNFISEMKSKNSFFSVTTLGAISAPKNPNLVLEGYSSLNNSLLNEIIPAVETYTFSPAIKKSLLLDPVAVSYSDIDDETKVFESTRLCFYSLSPDKMSPHHQGVVSTGVDLDSYESSCLFGEIIAKKILNESFSFLTAEFGADQNAENVEEGVSLIRSKYANCPAMRNSEKSEFDIFSVISGKMGPTHGLSAEVFSLTFQQSDLVSPILFSCCIYAASFLSDIRTYPQRFDLKKYLNSVE